MFKITYHLKDPYLRKVTDLTDYEDDFYDTAYEFAMVDLIEVTPTYYTILVKTNNNYQKNRIVRAFGREFATTSPLGAYVEHNTGSSTLFVAKKVVEV